MALNKDVKANLVKKFGKDQNDTGSIEVQRAKADLRQSKQLQKAQQLLLQISL